MHRVLATIVVLLGTALAPAQEKLFSGPQPGEKLPAFTVRGVLGDDAGKDLDFVTRAAGKPIVIVFVHEVNRPSIALTRILTSYTVTRLKDGLHTGVVWLGADATEAEAAVQRVQHALTKEAPIGVSTDGQEGPGALGLNRNVALTIVVAKENKVTANFALVQPSLQVDLPKILDAVVAVAGGKAPRLEDIPGAADMMKRDQPPKSDEKLTGLLRSLIQRDASEESVNKTAAAIEEYVRENASARSELGRITSTVVGGGKLDNYGTPHAREYLKKWASAFGGKPGRPREKK